MTAADSQRPSLVSNIAGTTDMPDEHWVTAMGMVLEIDPPAVRGRAPVLPSMASPYTGRTRAGVLATLVDLVGGHVPDGPRTPTIDLRVQLVGPVPLGGEFALAGRAKKVGRRLVLSETELRDDTGRLFALGTTTFMNQQFDFEDSEDGIRPVVAIESFERLIDAREVDSGVLDIHTTPRLSNGRQGTIQGGAQAFAAELAAEHLLGPDRFHVVDLEIRYLNRLTVGPLRAIASEAGTTGPLHAVRVDLVDAGADETRLVSTASLLCAENPSG